MKTENTMKTNSNRGPGRPKYQPIIPTSRFTMTELCEVNGVNLQTGKGKNCSRLTLIKFLARDAKRKDHSLIVRLTNTFAEPKSEDGLGRKSFVYQLRSFYEAVNAPQISNRIENLIIDLPKVDLFAHQGDMARTSWGMN